MAAATWPPNVLRFVLKSTSSPPGEGKAVISLRVVPSIRKLWSWPCTSNTISDLIPVDPVAGPRWLSRLNEAQTPGASALGLGNSRND